MDEKPEAVRASTHRRTCGLRFSVADGIVLVIASVTTVATYSVTYGYSLFILFVVGHFFLFCNVFRIRRKPELVWGTIFLVNCALWMAFGMPSTVGICATQFVVTVLIIGNELRHPSYHGVFSKKINPHIEEYLSGSV